VPPSSIILNSSETCPKQASLSLSLEREALTFHQLLSRGIEHGVQCDDENPARAASDEVMRLCLSRPIETEQSDLLGLSEHVSALAELVTWILRTGPAWQHPLPLKLGSEIWLPSCWAIPGGLRRVVLVDHWSDRRALQEARDWQTLEGALYGLPVTILAVVLGAMRNGRRHGPLTRGYLHPRSGELRFRKRDGTGFDGNWESVFREQYPGTRDDWIEAMNQDGVMTETFVIHPAVEFEANISEGIRALAQSKLGQVRADGAAASRNLSRCFDSVRVCEFRHPCAFFKEPTIGKGFVQIAGYGTEVAAPLNGRREPLPQR
jgi:hypothetical protein